MSFAQWVGTLIFAVCFGLAPLILAAASYFFRLPEQQRQALLTVATMVVQAIEQESASMGGVAKKELATAKIAKHLATMHLPMPPQAMVSDAIESAVLQLPKKQ